MQTLQHTKTPMWNPTPAKKFKVWKKKCLKSAKNIESHYPDFNVDRNFTLRFSLSIKRLPSNTESTLTWCRVTWRDIADKDAIYIQRSTLVNDLPLSLRHPFRRYACTKLGHAINLCDGVTFSLNKQTKKSSSTNQKLGCCPYVDTVSDAMTKLHTYQTITW